MASSSSSNEENANTTKSSTYDIFLSHSGAQKGFVKGLHKMLPRIYKTFFDIDRSSLPLGKPFPPLIFEAAKACKLAVVVVSHEFITSKWPMLELCTFVNYSVTMLPIFFNMKPNDLKKEENKKEWLATWQEHATKDPRGRIDVSGWEKAVGKLGPMNGLVFDPKEGEVIFTETVVNEIERILPSKDLKLDNPERVVRVLQQVNFDHGRIRALESNINFEALTYINEVAKKDGKKGPIVKMLVDLKVIPELVQLLKSVNEHNTRFMNRGGWALKNVVWQVGESAKEEAVEVGAMEVLVKMLEYEMTTDCAIYCLRTMLDTFSAQQKLRELDNDKNVQVKLRALYQKFEGDDRISPVTKNILSKMKWNCH